MRSQLIIITKETLLGLFMSFLSGLLCDNDLLTAHYIWLSTFQEFFVCTKMQKYQK